jgi:hypothetical protein
MKAKDLSSDDICKALQEKFYINVPFPSPDSVIEDAIQAFFKFLQEPDDVKNHIDYSINLKHRRGDIGFKHRDPGEGIYNDAKDFFHFHPSIFSKYKQFLETHPVVNDFVKKPNQYGILHIKYQKNYLNYWIKNIHKLVIRFLIQIIPISYLGFFVIIGKIQANI